MSLTTPGGGGWASSPSPGTPQTATPWSGATPRTWRVRPGVFNRYVSVYYLLGLAHADTDVTYEGRRQGMKKNALGVQVNPWKGLVLDASVEYAGFSDYPLRGTEAESVIFAMGAGYRF
ncbi:hypothetical protein QDX92_004637 [Salmonella enterica]|nr:hypothetical protein [Salmonella enterica]EKT1775885.1 hypothetical protein [Salmonella enterica]EKT1780485.1 hypothetical protein [Salmonella enterica]